MSTWYAVYGASLSPIEVIKETEKTLLIESPVSGKYRVYKGGADVDYLPNKEDALNKLKENLNNQVAKAEKRLQMDRDLREEVFKKYNIEG